jgi:hypothetical protein
VSAEMQFSVAPVWLQIFGYRFILISVSSMSPPDMDSARHCAGFFLPVVMVWRNNSDSSK